MCIRGSLWGFSTDPIRPASDNNGCPSFFHCGHLSLSLSVFISVSSALYLWLIIHIPHEHLPHLSFTFGISLRPHPLLSLSLSHSRSLSLPLIGCSWFQIIAAVYCWGALYIKGQSLKWRGRMLAAMMFNGYLMENIYEKWKRERGQKEVCWIDKSLQFSGRIIYLCVLEISVFV